MLWNKMRREYYRNIEQKAKTETEIRVKDKVYRVFKKIMLRKLVGGQIERQIALSRIELAWSRWRYRYEMAQNSSVEIEESEEENDQNQMCNVLE